MSCSRAKTEIADEMEGCGRKSDRKRRALTQQGSDGRTEASFAEHAHSTYNTRQAHQDSLSCDSSVLMRDGFSAPFTILADLCRARSENCHTVRTRYLSGGTTQIVRSSGSAYLPRSDEKQPLIWLKEIAKLCRASVAWHPSNVDHCIAFLLIELPHDRRDVEHPVAQTTVRTDRNGLRLFCHHCCSIIKTFSCGLLARE